MPTDLPPQKLLWWPPSEGFIHGGGCVDIKWNDPGTQVELVTADTGVKYEIIHIPTSSTYLCESVKRVGCHSNNDNKDLDYI